MLEVLPEEAAGADRRRADDQEAPAQVAGQSAGQNRGARRPDPHLECEVDRARRRRPKKATKKAKKKPTRKRPRRKRRNGRTNFTKHYKERVMPALQEQHGYKNVHQIPKVEKVVINTSVGSQAGREAGAGRREGGAGLDHRPEAGRDAREEEHREFQAAQGPGDRRQGDVARRADV